MGRKSNLRKRYATGQAAARAGIHIPSERVKTRPGRGTPLPPKGIASGAEPVITGVVVKGKTLVLSGKNLNNVHLAQSNYIRIDFGEGAAGTKNRDWYFSPVVSKNDFQIVLDIAGNVGSNDAIVVYGFANATHLGHLGKPIKSAGLPKTIQIGGVKGAAAKQPKPMRPTRRRRR